MVSNDDIAEALLPAYMDRQLEPQLQQVVRNAMRGDARIPARVGELRMTKDWMRAAFSYGAARTLARARHRRLQRRVGRAPAASGSALPCIHTRWQPRPVEAAHLKPW